jgi:rare lipoprotein A
LKPALISAAALIALSACASGGSHGRSYTSSAPVHYDKVGTASWYGAQYDGRATASGERFDMHALSGAHASLPIPSIVEVTNLENGRSIRVRLNDRGPFKDGRIIDLSKGAAEALGFVAKGVTRVRVRYIGPAPAKGSRRAEAELYTALF